MSKLSHIGIAVNDLEKSINIFSAILNCTPESIEELEDQQIRLAIFRPGGKENPAIELIAPTEDNKSIKAFLEKRGEGLHHISLQVNSLAEKLKSLETAGFQLIDKTPRTGSEGKQIAFLHPKATSGVLIELEQK
jgi:methylmalonyl-CoA/ethylmalonyl-CoA epimerase